MEVSTLLKIARSEIGTAETPINIVKYNDEYWGTGYRSNGSSYPWCVVFQWYCFRHAGDTGAMFPNTAHCDGVRSYAKGIGRWINRAEIGVNADLKAGDLVIFDYDNDGSGDHIGLIETVTNNNAYTTIEGNYADKVMRVNRSLNGVSGIYRPAYEEGENDDIPEPVADSSSINVTLPTLKNGAVGASVEMLQFLLMLNGYQPPNSLMRSGHYDGEFGIGTETALKNFQISVGHTADGICGDLTWSSLLEVVE